MKKILSIGIIIVTLLAMLSSSAFAADGINWYVKHGDSGCVIIPPGQEFITEYGGIFKSSAAGAERRIYLTFDAGYENGNVARILDVLKEKNVPAAFFILKHLIVKNTDLVLRMAKEGHLVCNHTTDHKDLSLMSSEEIRKRVVSLEELYKQTTGYDMAKFFRFPEGRYSKDAIAEIYKLGYTTVFWSFAYPDWDNGRQPDAKWAMDRILSATHGGEILLLHPTSDTNAEILGALIDNWRQMGYSFGSLDEIAK